MNQSLTRGLLTRLAAAEKRFEILSENHERGGKPDAQTTKAGLRQLGEVLEDLRVATEHLQLAADDIADARREATISAERYRELYEGLPIACVLTNDAGCVDEANALASKLLNVAGPYLPGKPLLLYLQDRTAYFALLDRVRESGEATAIVHLRPRDRKPVEVRLRIAALEQQSRWCWIFEDTEPGRPMHTAPLQGVLHAGELAASRSS